MKQTNTITSLVFLDFGGGAQNWGLWGLLLRLLPQIVAETLGAGPQARQFKRGEHFVNSHLTI